MPKKYKLLIDSPEYPKGTIAQQINENGIVYQLSMLGVECASELYAIHIENRPTVWQEIEEVQEKKMVERWRAETLKPYYVMGTAFEFYDGILSRRTNYHDGNYFRKRQVSELAHKRVQIMCRLMGLAETIEEGSTECKGERFAPYITTGGELYICMKYSGTQWTLATFSTKELAQLFLDSAGQDALDWYGAVK